MKTKKRLVYAISLAMSVSLSMPIQAVDEGWTSVNDVWSYRHADGTLAKNWISIDGCWYAFDELGEMKTGWIASDEKWYFMGESGVMQNDAWVNSPDGFSYFIKGTGVMATDYIKDGYELDSSGKSKPIDDTKSIEFTENMDLANKIIEGNLYIDAAKFKELELSGITVIGKLVIMGNEIQDSKITIKDSTVNTISSQTRGAEITLSGTTTVKSIQIEENSTIKPGKDYAGKVESIEIQSTAQNEVKIEVPAKTVNSNTFAPITIDAKIDNLSVNKKTELTVNADIKNIAVNNTASDTKVEVSKGNTVGAIETEAKIEVSGSGNVDKVTGAGKDESIVTPKPERPSGGGGGSSNPPTPPIIIPGVAVSDEVSLLAALINSSVTEIYLENDITIAKDAEVPKEKNALTINFNKHKIDGKTNNVALAFNSGTALVKNGTVNALSGTFCTIRVRNSAIVNVENMILYNETPNGNSIKVSGTGTVNIRNTISTSKWGGGMEATGGTINVLENNTFTQTGSNNYNSMNGAASNEGTLNIEGGTFTSENFGLYVFNSGGTINVKGGDFTANTVLKADKCTVVNNAPSIINIDGGTFDGKIDIQDGAVLKITAGTFKNTGLDLDAFKKYVDVGSTVKENNGVFVVTVGVEIATESILQPIDVLPENSID